MVIKALLKLSLPLILQVLTISNYAQVNPVSAIGIGAGLGKGIAGKIKEGKKKKAIENGLTAIEINGAVIKILRVPEDKIISKAKGYILRIQNQLDIYQELYKNNKHLEIPYNWDDIISLKMLDPDWATQYYENELNEYRKYEQKYTEKEKHIRDSTAIAIKAEQKRMTDSLQQVKQRYQDSIAFAERVQGYWFVNKEFTVLKEKPSEKSAAIGKVYRGSYLKMLGYSDNSSYVKVALEDIEGFINKNDLTNTIDKIEATNTDKLMYKSRRYYKYEPNDDYTPEQKQLTRSSTNTKASKSKSSAVSKRTYKKTVRYIRGPRGGCYYIAGHSKVYVDRSLCD